MGRKIKSLLFEVRPCLQILECWSSQVIRPSLMALCGLLRTTTLLDQLSRGGFENQQGPS